MHEAHEAPRAVAALLDLAAVGIEDAVAEIGVGAGGRLHQQDLVAADAEVAVGDEAQLVRRQRDGLAYAVDDHEVVAGAVHLGEAQPHAAHYPAAMQSNARGADPGRPISSRPAHPPAWS